MRAPTHETSRATAGPGAGTQDAWEDVAVGWRGGPTAQMSQLLAGGGTVALVANRFCRDVVAVLPTTVDR